MSEINLFNEIIGSEYLSEIENEVFDDNSSSSGYESADWEWNNVQTDTASDIDSDFEDQIAEHRLNMELYLDEVRQADDRVQIRYLEAQREWNTVAMDEDRLILLDQAVDRLGMRLMDQDQEVIDVAHNVIRMTSVSEDDVEEVLEFGWSFLSVAMPWWKMEHFLILRHAFLMSHDYGLAAYRKLPGIGKMYFNMSDEDIRAVLMGSKYKRARILAERLRHIAHNVDHYRVLWRTVCDVADSLFDPFFSELEGDILDGLSRVSAADSGFKMLREIALAHINVNNEHANNIICINNQPFMYGAISYSDDNADLADMLMDGSQQDVTIERWPDYGKEGMWPAYAMPFYDVDKVEKLRSEFRCAGCKYMGTCDMVFGSHCGIRVHEHFNKRQVRLHIEKRDYGWVMIFDYKYFSLNYVLLYRAGIYISLGCLGMVFDGQLYKVTGTVLSMLSLPAVKSVSDVMGEFLIWQVGKTILNIFPSFRRHTLALQDQIKMSNELDLPTEIVFMINKYLFSPVDLTSIKDDANRVYRLQHAAYRTSHALIF